MAQSPYIITEDLGNDALARRGEGNTPALLSHLEHVECLKLDGSEGVLQEDHHQLQILHVAHVPDHHLHVRPVQQNLAKQLQGQCIGWLSPLMEGGHSSRGRLCPYP